MWSGGNSESGVEGTESVEWREQRVWSGGNSECGVEGTVSVEWREQ